MDNLQPYAFNANSSFALVNNTTKTLTFKDASAKQTRAHRIMIRIDAPAAFSATTKIYYKVNGAVDDVAPGESMWIYAGDNLLTIPAFVKYIEFHMNDAAGCTVYFDAYSHEDISGFTAA